MKVNKSEILALLKEDCAMQDVTTNSVIVQNKVHKFEIVSKNSQEFILCGIEALEQALKATLARYQITNIKQNGQCITNGQVIVAGSATIKELLQVERSVLNIIQHLSGIATQTRQFVEAVSGNVQILDTRKTMPFLRKLQKYAVKIGGGQNHRINLAQMAMLKDNHIIAAEGSITNAVRLIKKKNKNIKIEVECETIEQVKEALRSEIDIIMLDNMPPNQILQASKLIREHKGIKIEVSGGITLQNIGNYTGLDIDYISVGSLTNCVQAVDISMDIKP